MDASHGRKGIPLLPILKIVATLVAGIAAGAQGHKALVPAPDPVAVVCPVCPDAVVAPATPEAPVE